MDASAAVTPALSTNHGQSDLAVQGVPSGPGWLVLRDCPLGGGPPVDLALLHNRIGVALVDFGDTAAAADAADRFRRALDERRFPAIFGGYPPVVRTVVPADRLPELGQILSALFRAEPPMALEGGDAWVPSARSALEARPAAGYPKAAAGARGREVSPWRAAVFVAAAAAVGAAMAAAVVMPPRRDAGDAPALEATVPRLADPSPWAAAPGGGAPPFPAGPPRDTAEGADTPFVAAVPHEAGGGPSPATARNEPEPPAPPAAPPEIPAAADPAARLPPPLPFAAVAPPYPFGAAGRGPEPGPGPLPPAAAGPPAAAPPPAAAAPRVTQAVEPAGGKRCRDILVKTTLGERLSYADKQHLRRGCHPPRD